jgi:hypothetical protein
MELYSSLLTGSLLFMGMSVACRVITSLTKRSSLKYRSFSGEFMSKTIVVDCTHQYNHQLTHHLKISKQKQLMDLSLRGDSSTDAVINCLIHQPTSLNDFEFVATNHFDVDSFFSVWCLMNPDQVLANQYLLRECARIGDFRELVLENETQHKALKLVCWLNSEEKRIFYRPFESKISVADGEEDGDGKFDYFLPRFADVMTNIDQEEVRKLYTDEYNRVLEEYKQLHSLQESSLGQDHHYANIGLSIVRAENPLHYYSLFSCSLGSDIVLAIYSSNRYELETKYTTFVDISSRPSLPRVETLALAKHLDELEQIFTKSTASSYSWLGNRMTDSGPLLRLEDPQHRLTKAERYGHPYERPIYSSQIPENVFVDTVISYYQHAYQSTNIKPKLDWTWTEIHDFNSLIDWAVWKPPHSR